MERDHELAGVVGGTEENMQNLFSGDNCNANELGLSSAAIDVYLREPTSGTMNTTEATVFRRPFNVDPGAKSQEKGVGTNNPLKNACAGGGGSRFRADGTGEELKSVQKSFTNNGHDGIGYTFFSWGNMASLGADSSTYGYLTLDGVDPLWHVYGATGVDPGQNATAGVLPGVADLPGSCGGNFPCQESLIWGHNTARAADKGLSFPNIRNGSYRAWNILTVISNGTGLTNLRTLVTHAQSSFVTQVPDLIPAIKVTAGGQTDPGLLLLRSHYQQVAGGVNIGSAPVNIASTGDTGGSMGGCILTTNLVEASSDTTTQLAQGSTEHHCVVIP